MREQDREPWRARLARQWADLLDSTAYLPMASDELVGLLRESLEQIVDALVERDGVADTGQSVGRRLVALNATGEDSLQVSIGLLRDHLMLDGIDPRDVVTLLAAVSSGYAAADRQNTFEQQERLKCALLRSKLDADRACETNLVRFREIFTGAPVGIAICDLGGRVLEANPALVRTFGRDEDELVSMCLHELFDPAESRRLLLRYGDLMVNNQRVTERCQLRRADGDEAFVQLHLSLLSNGHGSTRQLLAMVQDTSELHHLQERFQHQALHDPLTGLANRQFFRSRLETAMSTLRPGQAVTMYHLALDGFELINDGLGYQVGDTMIKSVARRLEQVTEGEDAMVARFGGTEFAILLTEASDTPDPGSYATLINQELAEPIYVQQCGMATSASIGVARHVQGADTAVDLTWAAEVALRRARAAGRRQWALFDPDRAPRERDRSRLAAIIPGALELGEFQLGYQPVIILADGTLGGFGVRLSWHPQGHEPLDHAECLSLAERSGVTLPLRDWLLRAAWEQLEIWDGLGYRPRIMVDLSPHQFQDPDLVATVRSVLTDVALDPSRLWLSVPADALHGDDEESVENLKVLGDAGIYLTVHGFRASPQEVRRVCGLPVHSVRLAPDLVDLVHDSTDVDAAEVRVVAQLLPIVRDCGKWVLIDGVATETQAQRWRELGCDAALGPYFGAALDTGEVCDYLDRVPLSDEKFGRAREKA